MLDLKKLEKKLDEALETETVKSLKKWLAEQRKKVEGKGIKLYFKLRIDKLAAVVFFTGTGFLILYHLTSLIKDQ